MKILSAFLCLILSQNAFSQEISEESYRSFEVGVEATGGDKYSNIIFDFGIPLGTKWYLNAELSGSQTDTLKANESRAWAEFDITRDFGIQFGLISRTEPGDIRGAGGTAGARWSFNLFGDLKTHLNGTGETVRYWQTVDTRASVRLNRDDVLVQRSLLLSVTQELGKGWHLGLSVIGYGYDQDPEAWSDAVLYRYWTVRAAELPIPGFPQSSSALRATYFIRDEWFVDLALLSSRGYGNVKGDGASLSTTYVLMPDWSFEIGVSSSRTEGVRSGGLLTLGARYMF